jgi:hypothetical protein
VEPYDQLLSRRILVARAYSRHLAKYLRVRECSPAMVKSLFGGDFDLKLNDLMLLKLNIASNINWIVNHSVYWRCS